MDKHILRCFVHVLGHCVFKMMFTNTAWRPQDFFNECRVRAPSNSLTMFVASVHQPFVCPYTRLYFMIRRQARRCCTHASPPITTHQNGRTQSGMRTTANFLPSIQSANEIPTSLSGQPYVEDGLEWPQTIIFPGFIDQSYATHGNDWSVLHFV